MKSTSGPMELFSVLLIDDQPIVAEAVKRLLGETRFKYCSDPTQAVTMACDVSPTVILLDLVMPEIDGLTLIQSIREHPRLAKIPVILLSTREDPEQKAMAFELGANDYLIKLPHRVELMARLRYHSQAYVRLLQRDQALQALRASQKQLEETNLRLQTLNDELKEANRARGQFLARMSHEIRTPINGILGITQLLRRTSLQPRQSEYAELISNSGELLLSLIEDILDFSKIDADKLVLEQVEFEPAALLEQVMQLLAVPAHKKKLEFIHSIDPEIPDFLLGDPTRIRQILLNLIGNAIKFTSQGQVKVEVRQLSSSDEGVRLKVCVQDTGIGITPEQAGRLFQAFNQADNSTTRRFGGTGLGLAIARNLCEHMQGSLELSSQGLGCGSLFVAEICLAPAARPPHPPTPPARVLVVDNSSDWRSALACMLKKRSVDFCCLAAHDPLPGTEQNWDLILVDSECWAQQDWPALFPDSRIVRMQRLGEESQQDPSPLLKPIRRQDLFALLEQQPGPEIEVPAEQPTGGVSARILLVEDNLINQTIALDMLKELGHPVDLAENGREAVDMSEREHYSVIIMDCEMPEMDGFQATAAIRAREDGKNRTPIVAMTAYAMHGDRERCLQAGMDDYITKPFDMTKVSQIIERWLV